eukprot:scaffold230962_cov15-Tisochrysis_lutea.AAC.1
MASAPAQSNLCAKKAVRQMCPYTQGAFCFLKSLVCLDCQCVPVQGYLSGNFQGYANANKHAVLERVLPPPRRPLTLIVALALQKATSCLACGCQLQGRLLKRVENKKGSGDYLPPVDHSLVDYEDFAKVCARACLLVCSNGLLCAWHASLAAMCGCPSVPKILSH